MDFVKRAQDIVRIIKETAEAENKLTGFFIGNTAKIDSNGLYFTPIRNTSVMIAGGVIVYSEQQAIDIAKAIDGEVEYILVDAEKKIPDEMSLSGDPANVERSVREAISHSTLWIYKGNDLSVEAVDSLLTQLTKHTVHGIGGAQVCIIGAGNLGAKLALKLVERGAHVTITRRNEAVLKSIVSALNHIKPGYTISSVKGTTNNAEAAQGAKILIGATQGTAVITAEMVDSLAEQAIIVDVGKGTLYPKAIDAAEKRDLNVYRLDVSTAFEGLIHKLWATENTVEKKFGRRQLHGESIVSGGLMGRKEEIVVDNVWQPKRIYGIANGRGDFIRELSSAQVQRIERLQNIINQD